MVLHNAVGLVGGYGLARLARVPERQARTLAIEVGKAQKLQFYRFGKVQFCIAADIDTLPPRIQRTTLSGKVEATYETATDAVLGIIDKIA